MPERLKPLPRMKPYLALQASATIRIMQIAGPCPAIFELYTAHPVTKKTDSAELWLALRLEQIERFLAHES